LAFDLGKSDIKTVAVKDGEALAAPERGMVLVPVGMDGPTFR